MAEFSFGLGRDKSVGVFVDQTLIGTPIPVITSTIDKKAPETVLDENRLMRLEALRTRASWISNAETPRASPKENPISDKAKNDNSEPSRTSSSKATTGRKSTESFQSILNLQTMDDLSGSIIDVNIASECVSAKPSTLRIDVGKEADFREQVEGNKENTLMPCVGISPGDSLQNEEDEEVLRTRHDSADIESFKDELTLNWDEITRPPSPPVSDKNDSKQTLHASSNSSKLRSDAVMPSWLLGRTEAAPLLPSSSVEASSGSQRRLESILTSDNSELSNLSFSLSGGSGVRRWVHNIPSGCGSMASDAFRQGSPKKSPSFTPEHQPTMDNDSIGSLRSKGSFMEELKKTPEHSFPHSENFDAQRVTSTTSWLTDQQVKDDTWRSFVAGRENTNILSGVGLSSVGVCSDNTSTYPSILSPVSAAQPERMPSIREEAVAEEVTINDDTVSHGLSGSKKGAVDAWANQEALSVSALRVDNASVATSGQSRGVRGHPLASSTVASLTASLNSSEDGSSLVNLSDIRHALDNDLWESHGPSGVASFVENRAKEERKRKKERKSKPSSISKDSKDSSTMRASSGGTVRQSAASSHSRSPVERWVSLRESTRDSPPSSSARRTPREDFVDLAASSLERSVANGFIASLASSQATAVKVNSTNTNNNNMNSNCRESSDTDGALLNCVAQLVFPPEVTFSGVCLRGCQTERSFSLTNRRPRTVSCQLEVIYCAVNGEPLTKDLARRVFPVRPSLVLGSGATRVVRVFFKPHRAGAYAAELRIAPDHNPAADLVVNLSASAEVPNLRLLLSDEVPCEEKDGHGRLDFGTLVWGAGRSQRLLLMNEGQAELPVLVRLEVTSRLALRCFSLRTGEGRMARQVELTLVRNGGSAELDLHCQMPEQHEDLEQMVVAQATLMVSLQGITQDSSSESLATLSLCATGGSVRLAVPRQFAVVRLNDRQRSTAVPLRNEGSLPATVRLSLELDPGAADSSALRLSSRAKASILPGEQTLVELGYERRKVSFGPGDRLSGTLFAIVEPSGPVFEVPLLFDPAAEVESLTGSCLSLVSSCGTQQPPLVASKAHLLWAGINVGNSERQRLLLKNTTDCTLIVTLCVEALDELYEKDTAEATGIASDSQAFFIVDPKTSASRRRIRLELRPACDFAVRLSFRPNAPRYSRARLLIRLPSHKTTFIVGLRGYGGRGQVLCASGESGSNEVYMSPGSSRQIVLYNRGDRCVWTEAETRPDCFVKPRSFLIPANSSKRVLLKSSERLHSTWDTTLRFRYGDEILRQAVLLCSSASWPASLEDPSGSATLESLPPEDRNLPWHEALTNSSSELAVCLKEPCGRRAGGDDISILDDSCFSGDAGGMDLALRETMVRIGHWTAADATLKQRSPPALPKSIVRSGTEASSREPRPKPHVEKWLRQQQELTASQLTSTTTFGKSLLQILSPLEVEFTAVGGPQERSVEWLNVSPWSISWRLRPAGPLRCESARCSSIGCLCSAASASSGSGSGAAFSFSPLAVARLAPGALQRVRLNCSGATSTCAGPHRQQWHLTATAQNDEEEEEEEEEPLVRRSETHPVLLTLRVAPAARADPVGPEASKSRLLVRQREVRFPLCRVHSRMEERLKVTNRSSQPVAVLFRALPEPFRLGERAPSQLVLKAAHCVMLPLVFRPTERGRFEAVLGIECPEVAGEAPIRVLLTGEAED